MKKYLKDLKKIASYYDVTVRLDSRLNYASGFYNMDKRSMILSTNFMRRAVISTFFHELAHVLDHREGIFDRYYSPDQTWSTKRSLALRAERHADLRGKQLCRQYYPLVRYVASYRNKKEIQFLKDHWTSD